MEKIFCGRRKRNAENHWENIDSSNIKITKPTILIFGGNLTTHPEQANSYAKVVYKLLNKYEMEAKNIHIFEDFDCLSFYYKQNLVVCTYNRRASGQILNEDILSDVEALYNNSISDLVEEEIRLAKTKQKDYFHPLSKLIMVAHSAGSQIAAHLEELIRARLLEELDEQTTYDLLKNVKYYGFASYVKVQNFNQTYIEGTKDVTTMEYYPAVSFDVEEGSETSVFNYYSCESPFYEREKHSLKVKNEDIIETDKLAVDLNLKNEKFDCLHKKLANKIIVDPKSTWRESMMGDGTNEINSINFAHLDNGNEKIVLLNVGHEFRNIVGGGSWIDGENVENKKIEDLFVHNTPKHNFNRKLLNLFDFKNLAYITLSDDMTKTLIEKCELKKTNIQVSIKQV